MTLRNLIYILSNLCCMLIFTLIVSYNACWFLTLRLDETARFDTFFPVYCNFQTINSELELKFTIYDFYFILKSFTSYENWNAVGFFVVAFFCLLVRILAHRSRNHELRTVQKTSFHGRYFRRISGLAGFHGLPHVARLGHWPYFAICYRESVACCFILFKRYFYDFKLQELINTVGKF